MFDAKSINRSKTNLKIVNIRIIYKVYQLFSIITVWKDPDSVKYDTYKHLFLIFTHWLKLPRDANIRKPWRLV